MTHLPLRLGAITGTAEIPSWALGGAGVVRDAFATSSGGAIELVPDVGRLSNPLKIDGTGAISTLDLHLALHELRVNDDSSIGLLLCKTFDPARQIFGIMFDTGFAVDNASVDPSLLGKPRQGCAIFLDAIQAARGGGGAYIEQTVFSAIHELGHVFNLEHDEQDKNFMRTSDPNNVYGPEYFAFTPQQQTWLSLGVTDSHVWPGGSEFGDQGLHHVEDNPWRKARQRDGGVILTASIGRRAFHYYEPVELDVGLTVTREVKKSISIPDVLDPGYEYFQIWIENPDRTTRLYRSPRRYCWSGQTITVGPRRPFRRDISIFGQAGGYTFSRAGQHRVWAELRLPQGQLIRSKPFEFEILPIQVTGSAREKLFTNRQSRILLYHRQFGRSRNIEKQFAEYLEECPRDPSAAAVRYALGRALLRQGRRLNEVKGQTLRNRAVEHLKKASLGPILGKRQRNLARSLLSEETGGRR